MGKATTEHMGICFPCFMALNLDCRVLNLFVVRYNTS